MCEYRTKQPYTEIQTHPRNIIVGCKVRVFVVARPKERKSFCCSPTNHRIWRKVFLVNPHNKRKGFSYTTNRCAGTVFVVAQPVSTPLEGLLLLPNQRELRYTAPPNKILGVDRGAAHQDIQRRTIEKERRRRVMPAKHQLFAVQRSARGQELNEMMYP